MDTKRSFILNNKSQDRRYAINHKIKIENECPFGHNHIDIVSMKFKINDFNFNIP